MVFLIAGLLVAFVQGGLVRRLAKGSAEGRMVLMGTLLVALALCLAPYVPADNVLVGLLPLGLMGLGQGMNVPALSSIISRSAPAEEQGGTLGVTQGFSSLARAVGPFLGTWLFYVRESLPFWTGAGLMVVAFLLAGRTASALRRRTSGAA